MHIAVVTPYYKEPLEVVRRCYDSVRAQTFSNTTHILVSDGNPHPEIDSWEGVVHIKLPRNDDFGDTPRLVGAAYATTAGYDGITLLDADNWFEPDHVETLLTLFKETGAPIITGTRTLRRPDTTILGVCTESDGQAFNDTNCYLIMRPAFRLFAAWGFKDRSQGIVGDRVFWNAVVQSGAQRAHCSKPTTNYLTTIAVHYLQRGEEPPESAKVIVKFEGKPNYELVPYKEFVKLQGGNK